MKPRRGITLLELMVATMLLGVIMTVCLKMLGAAAAQRRAIDQRQMAIREVANLMERLTARPWDELTAESVQDVRLSDEVLKASPDADLEIKITPTTDRPPAKRIDVLLRWQKRDGRFERHVELAAWVYAGG